MRSRVTSAILALFVMASSCSYHLQGKANHEVIDVAIPYIKGDGDGRLTDAIVNRIATSPRFSIKRDDAHYTLDIRLKKNKNSHVGYRYNRRESTGDLINRLIPIEERKKIVLEVSILDQDFKALTPNFEIEGEADFDFVNFDTYHDLAFIDQQGAPQSSLSYSLGQLDALDGANHSVYDALYQDLAKKILIVLENL